MAIDVISVTEGSGADVSVDLIGGVTYQRIKLLDGTVGSTEVIEGDSTWGLDVDVTRLPGTVEANISSLAGAISGSELQVDIVSIAAGNNNIGNVDIVTMPEVTIADIEDGLGDSVMDTSNNAMRVNVVAGGAGDGAIQDGVSSAIEATVFDYTSSNPLAVRLTNTDGDYVAAGAGTQYTEGDTDTSITGTAMLMEVASSVVQPIQGTVADGLLVNLGTNNDVTVTGSVAVTNAGITTIAGAVSGTEMQVDVLTMPTVAVTGTFWQATQPVSLASVPSHAVTNAGTFAVQVDGDALTALQLIDNLVLLEDVGHTTGDPGIQMLAVRDDTLNARSGAENDYEPLHTNADGALWTVLVAETTKVIGTVNIAASQTIAVTNAGTFATQATLQAGTAEIGKLAAGTAEIGFVKVASGSIASGAIASGAIASGAIASGAIASGAIAAGAIAAGATSIADNEDVAAAGADRLVKVAAIRNDTPVANDNVSGDGDYTQFKLDNFGKLWVAGTVPEDTAHISAESITREGARRIATLATSSGTDGDWSTVNQTNEGAAWASLAATATPNGLSVANFTSGDTYTALTATAQVIKASAGNLYGYYIYNPNTSATYVLVYNIAAASVTVGTSTAILVFSIPASSAANLMFPVPIPFSNAGFSVAATTTGPGNTAPSVALECMLFYL